MGTMLFQVAIFSKETDFFKIFILVIHYLITLLLLVVSCYDPKSHMAGDPE